MQIVILEPSRITRQHLGSSALPCADNPHKKPKFLPVHCAIWSKAPVATLENMQSHTGDLMQLDAARLRPLCAASRRAIASFRHAAKETATPSLASAALLVPGYRRVCPLPAGA